MENFVVTFARGFGSGGKVIASQLAKDLGIHCYENRILTLAKKKLLTMPRLQVFQSSLRSTRWTNQQRTLIVS